MSLLSETEGKHLAMVDEAMSMTYWKCKLNSKSNYLVLNLCGLCVCHKFFTSLSQVINIQISPE